MKAYYITFGCRTNKYDTELIKSNLKLKGIEETDRIEDADFIIINSCAVTKKAERDARKALSRAYRLKKPSAKVILTGCVPKVKKLNRADLEGSVEDVLKHFGINPEESIVREYTSYSRAVLKVQEGCNFVCSYCVIRIARGRSRSKPIERILAEMDALESSGVKEVMITGIQVGDWGKEWGMDLSDLLRILVEKYRNMRFRLSSILPLHVSRKLIELYKAYPENLMRHFHISLQSASDKVLKDMKRPYTIDIYRKFVDPVFENLEDVSVGTDIIVGFPTETDEDFMQTYKFCEQYPFSYMHVFEFSPREGTPAYSMKPLFPERIRKERVRAMVSLSRAKRRKFYENFLGKEVEILVENRKNGYFYGLTSNYLRVRFPANSKDMTNSIVFVRTHKLLEDEMVLEGEAIA